MAYAEFATGPGPVKLALYGPVPTMRAMSIHGALTHALTDIDDGSSPMCHPSWARTLTVSQRLRDLARLRRVRDRIDREYALPLDVEALARGVHMSAGHLSRQFTLAYGKSPYAYLMTRRIERAMALSRRGDLSVTEVCRGRLCVAGHVGPAVAGNHAIVTNVAAAMNVEIWSDVVCPWCYMGKRRFERALASFGHPGEVTVTYRSFELDPDAPAQRGGTHAEHLARKYGMTIAQAEQADQQMTQRAAADGLQFRFDLIRGGNTFDAHRLLHLAKDHGLQPEMKERLLRATFAEGLPIADKPTLVLLATETGLPAERVQAVLDGDAYADAVRADEEQAARYGITGVPFFVADGRYAVSGAQPPEVLQQLLQRAYDERSQVTPVAVTADGNAEASCDGDSCAVG